MNLIIDSSLTAPPSEVMCFRDVTLYGTLVFEDILIQCPAGTRSSYWKWLKNHGAHDFISQLIRDYERERGFRIAPVSGNLNVDRVNVHNISFIVSVLNSLKKS